MVYEKVYPDDHKSWRIFSCLQMKMKTQNREGKTWCSEKKQLAEFRKIFEPQEWI